MFMLSFMRNIQLVQQLTEENMNVMIPYASVRPYKETIYFTDNWNVMLIVILLKL
jgi:type II secretory pathway component PulK